VRSKDDLYAFVGAVDWTQKLPVGGTLKCDTTLGLDIPADLTHSHFCSLTVKNAVVDQFRDKFGSRPDVDLSEPDLPLTLYLHRGTATLYRVWSGEASLHKRGYRTVIHKAALRETTAAALVLMSGWDCSRETLCDPMCGSGTIAIEAALIAAGVAPGLIRYGNSEKGSTPVSAR
jgi:23S rRNA G2445 N2-methylase RlmL